MGKAEKVDVERRLQDAARAAASVGKRAPAFDTRRAEREGLVDVAWCVHDNAIVPLLLAATPEGLVRVDFADDDAALDRALEDLAHDISPRVVASARRLDPVRRALDRYFARRGRLEEVAVDWRLTKGFRREVLVELHRVPYGETVTYGELAMMVGHPKAARAVGTACATNPIPIVVPCHRVLPSTGGVGNYGGGVSRKVALLDLEGAARLP